MTALRWFAWAVCLAVALQGCATAPPKNTENICEILTEKGRWYRHVKQASDRWRIPVPVIMAFVHKESSFQAKARPARTKLLWFIPWTRPSSAYGYAQATNETWVDYQRDTGRWGADRDDFADAMDFIGWYNHRSVKQLGIQRTDAWNLYVAYHEGLGGYRSGQWKRKANVKRYASVVKARADAFTAQLKGCEHRLDASPWWWPF